ncbi:uridine nucleosidase [Lasallia pustulata]|uniref:Uridine nucleosidase n=1 Tax=Lasallia pustulata TaxID=136370 RepID=A0A1W5CXS9_9LECA|nr:uridine nucleosidase [Lasallia pustulata]
MEDTIGPGKPQIPLWLDCDPGHDDAFAILLAAHHPNLDLLGISTVHGNASLERTTVNAGSVLTAIRKADISVYPGAVKPFCRKAVHAPDIHGTSGLDGTDLLPSPTSPPITDVNAVSAMQTTLLAQPKNTAWLVATGALTNVALLFASFPEVASHIKGLSIMGGAIGGRFTNAPLGHVKGKGERFGNITPWAEFNIYCDPEAAQSIFSNPVLASKTTLIPLDVTHQVLADTSVQQQLLQGPSHTSPPVGLPTASSRLRKMLHDLLMFFAHTYASVFGITTGPPLHDPIAVAVLLEAKFGATTFDDGGGERWLVNVVTEGIHSDRDDERGQLGRTIIEAIGNGGEGVRIPRGLNVKRFWDVLEHCVSRAAGEM